MDNNIMLGYSAEDFAVFRKNAWRVLWGFSILYCFLYCARLNLGLAIPAMIEQTSWTAADLGILSAIFFWTYGMGHLFNGRLGEIFGVNRFIVTGVFLSAIANILISFQASLLIIAVLWGLNGYFQSMLWSPGMALLSRWWPGNTRGFATGLANAFSGFGQVAAWISVYAAFIIAPGLGWRSAFIFPVIAMVIIVVFYKFMVKGRPSEAGLEDYEEEDPERKLHEEELRRILDEKGKIYPYLHLFKQWRFDVWLIIIAGSSIARYGLLTWIPLYYVEVLEMSVKDGIVGTVLLPLGMGFGTLIVPWATDRFCPTNRLPAVILCALIAGATVFLFPQITSHAGAAALLFIAGFFIYAINGVVWAYATDIGGRVFAGTATGILDCFAYLGASVQAIYFGSVLTKTGNWTLVFAVITATCIIIAVAAIAAGNGLGKKAVQ
ncbi:MFS transporter [Sinanaerobacter chloroacetimidivorans]|uniref:MFS transporter n=1 Tax=Sinanaerobacter chloroacetimidivorans TaxID=2818044 RepID=A0A8J8B2R1_9FIRM|nr:MFS transporter [Sinanaerobacter chloroacetimidivorans]MBR0598987.1 MFS transporter [Sinanaerobacter chloroacetimidivorans]